MSQSMSPWVPRRNHAAPPHIVVATRYRTVADFVHGFCRSIDEGHVLIGVARAHEPGEELAFSACLAGGRTVFRGRGTVVELATSKQRPGVMGVKVAIDVDALDEESRAMHHGLQMARQALMLTQAAASAGFDGDVPEYARGAGPRLAHGTQPNARTAPVRALREIRDEPTDDGRGSTRASTAIAGVIFAPRDVALPPAPRALPTIGDEPEVDDQATRLQPRHISVPAGLEAREDGASAPCVPNLFAPQVTDRVEALDPAVLLPRGPRWGVLVPLLLLLAGATMLAVDVFVFT